MKLLQINKTNAENRCTVTYVPSTDAAFENFTATRLYTLSRGDIWSSATLYNNEQQKLRQQWFEKWVTQNSTARLMQYIDLQNNDSRTIGFSTEREYI